MLRSLGYLAVALLLVPSLRAGELDDDFVAARSNDATVAARGDTPQIESGQVTVAKGTELDAEGPVQAFHHGFGGWGHHGFGGWGHHGFGGWGFGRGFGGWGFGRGFGYGLGGFGYGLGLGYGLGGFGYGLGYGGLGYGLGYGGLGYGLGYGGLGYGLGYGYGYPAFGYRSVAFYRPAFGYGYGGWCW